MDPKYTKLQCSAVKGDSDLFTQSCPPSVPSTLLGHPFLAGSFVPGGQALGEHSCTSHEQRSTGSDHPMLPDMPPSCTDDLHVQ